MKRLFGTIFSLGLLFMAFGHALRPEVSIIQPIKYANIGPLAAVNFFMYCFKAMQDATYYHTVLETNAVITQDSEQLQALLKSYHKAPKKLHLMKNKLCKIMGLEPNDITIKLNKEGNSVYANSMYKLVSVDRKFLKRPTQHQWGVLAHELGHIKNEDSTGHVQFSIASAYAAAIGTYFVTSALHVPHITKIQTSLAHIINAAHSRVIERRADNEAAQVPGAAEGLMQHLENKKQSYSGEFTVFSTHPSFEERLASLKPFTEDK